MWTRLALLAVLGWSPVTALTLNIRQLFPSTDVPDADEAFDRAQESCDTLIIPAGTHLLSRSHQIGNRRLKALIGTNKDSSRLRWNAANLTVLGARPVLQNLTIMGTDGARLPNGCLIKIGPSTAPRLSRLSIGGIASPGSLQAYGVCMDLYGISDFSIDSVDFHDIANMRQSPATGFSGGIFLSGVFTPGASPSGGSIRDSRFSSISTRKFTPSDPGDGDGIRTFLKNSVPSANIPDFPIVIENCVFRQVQKSAVKISGTPGIQMNNLRVSSPDSLTPMTAAVRIQWGSRIKVSDLRVDGTFFTVANLCGEDIDIHVATAVSHPPVKVRHSVFQLQQRKDWIMDNIRIHLDGAFDTPLVLVTDSAYGGTGAIKRASLSLDSSSLTTTSIDVSKSTAVEQLEIGMASKSIPMRIIGCGRIPMDTVFTITILRKSDSHCDFE